MTDFHAFDPYDALVEMQARLDRLEHAHNKLAHAFQKTDHELNQLIQHFNNLQKSHLALSQLVSAGVLKSWKITPEELATAEQSFKK
jgi:predicted nuclease with TOPRIM domain